MKRNFKISDEVAISEINNESVILNLSTGIYFQTNELGSFIVSQLNEYTSLEDLKERVNYKTGDNRNFNDGDRNSVRNYTIEGDYSRMYNSPSEEDGEEERTTLIDNEARVYKGGSWLDRAYYLDPGQRRHLPGSMTTNFIGFRCAMSYLGESRITSKPRRR